MRKQDFQILTKTSNPSFMKGSHENSPSKSLITRFPLRKGGVTPLFFVFEQVYLVNF